MSAPRKPIVVVGSLNMDLVVQTARLPTEGETVPGTSFRTQSGGKGANQAVAVARLGYPVRMIGRVGDDAFGGQLRRDLEAEGVDVSGVSTTRGETGVAVIVVAQTGENSIVVAPGANALLAPEDLDRHFETLRSAGMVLTQLEIPMPTVEHLATICAREGLPLILDPAPAKKLPPGLIERVDWLTPNETEAAFFTGISHQAAAPAAIAATLQSQGAKGVVLKLGARGAYLAADAATGEMLSPFQVRAIDTTAAGDAFNGAFAAGLMMGKAPIEAARFAAAAAALSVTRAGAQSSMPHLAEVQALLETQR